MNIALALGAAAALGVDRLDAQLLLLHAMGRGGTDRAWLLAHDADGINAAVHRTFMGLCGRRVQGEPLAYLVGRKEFFGLDLMVDARVLVPRPETETLVDWALELAGGAGRVIDLGTGSGAIALALKRQRPSLRVEAVDTSTAALEVAAANAQSLGLDLGLRQASWLDGDAAIYDLIVANPPYVADADPHLQALAHEPRQALAGGADGLRDLQAIVAQSPQRLAPGGWLLLEHGWDQAPAVRGLLEQAGFRDVASRRDLAGIERCSGGKWLELG